MKTLFGTIAAMLVTTALIWGVPMLFQQEMEPRTIAMEIDMLPHEGDTAGGDVPEEMTRPAPAPYRGLVEKLLDHVQEMFWALVQAFLVARYVKQRS